MGEDTNKNNTWKNQNCYSEILWFLTMIKYYDSNYHCYICESFIKTCCHWQYFHCTWCLNHKDTWKIVFKQNNFWKTQLLHFTYQIHYVHFDHHYWYCEIFHLNHCHYFNFHKIYESFVKWLWKLIKFHVYVIIVIIINSVIIRFHSLWLIFVINI